jgi:3-oxoacyl-[acyl-carrier-protein] synthase II
MDQSALSLTAAVALALADARLTVSGPARERTGLFVGTTNASPAAWDEFRTTQKERGLAKVSAPAFTRLVLNAACGFATRVFSLRGPTTTLTTGQGSGLAALALAVSHLQTRSDADRLVVAAVDEADLARHPERPDAAVALVLTTDPREGRLRVSQWALTGPGGDVTPRRVPALASGSLLELALAVAARTPAVIHDASLAASTRVVLEDARGAFGFRVVARRAE